MNASHDVVSLREVYEDGRKQMRLWICTTEHAQQYSACSTLRFSGVVAELLLSQHAPCNKFFSWYKSDIFDWFPSITGNIIGIPAKRLGFPANLLVPGKDAAPSRRNISKKKNKSTSKVVGVLETIALFSCQQYPQELLGGPGQFLVSYTINRVHTTRLGRTLTLSLCLSEFLLTKIFFILFLEEPRLHKHRTVAQSFRNPQLLSEQSQNFEVRGQTRILRCEVV